MNSWINLNALWKIVVIGLLAGAGLPALFAVGLRALTPTGAPQPDLRGKASATLCFAIVLAAMAWGIYSIVHNS